MKEFDKNKSMVLIHTPKTAGISVKKIYEEWFSESLLYHYYDAGKKELPKKHDVIATPVFVYGHFNRSKQFGIEHYYPEIDQFISIIRDPFEMAVSGFFYVQKTNPNWKTVLNCPTGNLGDYLRAMKSGLLNFFPSEVTSDNYIDMIENRFVEVGVTEHLGESMRRISVKLGQEFDPSSLLRLNSAARNQSVPYDLKDQFIERHQLEFSVYNYVLSKYQ